MKKFFSLKPIFFVAVITTISGCSKSVELNGCTTQVNPIVINFNVLDKANNQDLYFSSSPTFQTKDLYFFRSKDLSRKDTIRPAVIGTGINRSFSYVSDYSSFKDTLILKTGNLSDNTLIYTIQKTEGSCVNYQLGTVSFNGSLLNPSSDKYILLKNVN